MSDKRYTDEFKVEAVKQITEHGYSVQDVSQQLGIKESLITYVADRLGHDRRYAMNYELATKELGYEPEYKFETINWYCENAEWMQPVTSGGYLQYMKKYYAGYK